MSTPFTTTRTWTFPTDLQSWVVTAGTSIAGAWSNAATSVADGTGCVQWTLTTGGTTSSSFIELTDTWVNIFNIPPNSFVSQVGTPDNYDWECTTGSRIGNCTTGPFELRDSGGGLQATLSAGATFSTTSSWATNNGSATNVPIAVSPATTTIKLRLNNTLVTGNGAGPNVVFNQDTINLSITFFPYYSRLPISVRGNQIGMLPLQKLFQLPA